MPTIDFIAHNEKTVRDFKPVLAKSISPGMVEKDKSWYAYQRRLCANYSSLVLPLWTTG